MERPPPATATINEQAASRNLEADRLIETGQPLKEVAALFPKKEEGYDYFARYMVAQFAPVSPCCAACGAQEGERYQFIWTAHLNTARTVLMSFLLSAVMLLFHHLYSRSLAIRFATRHRLCAPCWRRFRLRRIALMVFDKVLFAVFITTIFLTVPIIAFMLAGIFAAPEIFPQAAIGSVIGLALLGLIVLAYEGCRRWRIPPKLRQIGRFPFSLERVEKFRD